MYKIGGFNSTEHINIVWIYYTSSVKGEIVL